jgi:hypothetical protein
MKRILMMSLIASLITTPAHALDCIEKACIDVYTQDGKIVIEGRKGTGPVEKKAVVPKPARKPAVVTKKAIPIKPIASKPATVKPKVSTTTKKPVVKKPATAKTTTPATSLSDKLVEMLPTAGISYSPSFEPLIEVPVFFWSDIPEIVTKRIKIVGEVVEVSLRPTFFWHYGDGVIFVTRKVGAPFPDGQIQHRYSTPGHYLIQLITSWDGDFTVQGIKTRIPGEIRTVSILAITVVAAPTRFSPPILYSR